MELKVEEKRASLVVPQELHLHGDPKIASSRAVAGDGLCEVVRDGVGDPGLDYVVHVSPVQGTGGPGVEQNVVLKGKLASGEQKLVTPASVVIGVDVEGSRDQAPNVLDGDDLGMEVEDGGGLMQQHGAVKVVVFDLVGGGDGGGGGAPVAA